MGRRRKRRSGIRRAGELLALFIAAGSLGGGSSARATPAPNETARFVYTPGPEADGCPSAEDFKRGVETKLGWDPFSDDASQTVSASFERIGPDLVGRVQLIGADGRTVGRQEIRSRAPDCIELASALQVTLTIALTSTPVSPPTSTHPATPSVERPLPPAELGRFRFAVTAGALAAFSAEPAPAAGFALGFEARWPAFSLGLEGRWDASGHAPAGDGTVQSSLLIGEILPCYRWRGLGGCAIVAAGAERAETTGLPGAKAGSAPYFAPGARVMGEVSLGSAVGLRVNGDVLLPLTTTVINVAKTPIWQTPTASFALGIAAVAKVP